jgi:hypothetical protein
MALLTIPTFSDSTNYVFTTELDAITYFMAFRWNDRYNCWILSFEDVAGNTLVTSIAVLPGIDLLQQVIAYPVPQGLLYVIDMLDETLPPTQFNFGTETLLQYNEVSA